MKFLLSIMMIRFVIELLSIKKEKIQTDVKEKVLDPAAHQLR
jgi:hypothetical protein